MSSRIPSRFGGHRCANSSGHYGETSQETTTLPHTTRTAEAPGSYVGRIGALAVALGIGAAVATGLGAAVAHADQQDSSASSSGPANAQPSGSGTRSTAPGTGRTSRTKTAPAGTTTNRAGVAQEADSPLNLAAAPRGAASLSSAAKLPAAASAVAPHSSSGTASLVRPTATTPPPDALNTPVTVPAVSIPSLYVPSASSVVSPIAPAAPTAPLAAASASATVPTSAPALAAPAGTSQQPHPKTTAAIVSPSAARPSIATMITNVLASLSSAMSGKTPTVPTPADTSLALMIGAARRAARVPDAAAPTVSAGATATTSTTTTTIEAESMGLSPSPAGRVVSDSNASGGSAFALTSSGQVSTTVTLPASTGLVIRARASSGTPNMTLSVDGVPVTTVVVKSTSWSDFTFTGVLPEGSYVLSISSANATSKSALYLDKVTTATGPFVEDFLGNSGSAPKSSMWTVGSGSGWDIGIETYRKSNAVLDGQGNLVLKATRTRIGYASGYVETVNKVSFGYGTITARIKVPKGQGLWPAFWLTGADIETTGPGAGEVDVMELPSTTNTVWSTLHGPVEGSIKATQAYNTTDLPDLSTDFHNYWVRHLPNEITFGVDDQTLATFTPDSLSPGSTWVYNRPMDAILDLAVGGSWAGAPDSSTKFPAQMIVDSVRWDPPA